MPRSLFTVLSVGVLLVASSLAEVTALEAGTVEASVVASIRGDIRDASPWDLRRWRAELLRLYAARENRPLWFERGRFSDAGDRLLDQLAKVEERGLLRADYDVAQLRELVREADSTGEGRVHRVARADVAMSSVAARVAADLQRGRVDPASVGHELDVRRPSFDAIDAIGRLATSRNAALTLDSFEPAWLHYALLKQSLARHREISRELAAEPVLVPPRGTARCSSSLQDCGDSAASPASISRSASIQSASSQPG